VFAWQSAERRFQDAYARFLTDEQFRQSVLGWCSGDDLIDDLSEADLGRLQSMDQGRVKLFATCLFSNRIAAIAEAFPLSVKMMADALPSLVQALDAQNVAVDTRKYPEAARFADFVLNGGHEGAHQLSDPVLALLQYELAALNLRVRRGCRRGRTVRFARSRRSVERLTMGRMSVSCSTEITRY